MLIFSREFPDDLQSLLLVVGGLIIIYFIFNIIYKNFIKKSFLGKELVFRIFLFIIIGIFLFLIIILN
jgi:hypothetical protein